ncbi:MAG: hypothetical protein IKF19_05865 [Bacilli bacterium]|nr:hypothetical protein [Bacilli bacterium]
MNTYNINDASFINTNAYKEFMASNPSKGNLRIRAYAASGAIPISNLKVVVRTKINNDIIIFFEGSTNESGIIDRISLPAPKLNTDNMDAPEATTYEVVATYLPNDSTGVYRVNIYENVCVVQTISIVPEMRIAGSDV